MVANDTHRAALRYAAFCAAPCAVCVFASAGLPRHFFNDVRVSF